MTPLPKRRISHARQGKRRQAIRLKKPSFKVCSQCGALRRLHSICLNCGDYKGRVVVPKKEKKAKKGKG